MNIRTLITLIENNEQTNPQGELVDQFIKDINAGEISPRALQAVSNYVKKKIAQHQEPQQAQPLKDKVVPQQNKPQASITPQAPQQEPLAAPAQDQEISEAVKIELPAGVTLKPEDLRKTLLKGGFKSEAVNDIVTFAYRQTIEEACAKLAAMKEYKTEAGPMIAQLFYNIPGTLSQRNHIAHILTTTGVLDLSKFSKPGTGTFDDLIMSQYRSNPIVMNLKHKLKTRSDFPTQVSAAKKGAGEDLITILGNPVDKLSPGDLNINGKEIEIKGIGARLRGFSGPEVYGDPTRVYAEWATLVGQALGAEGQQVLHQAGSGLKRYMNFSGKNLNALNDAIQVSTVPNAGQYMLQAFSLLTEILYPKSDSKMREIILRSFDKKTGQFEVDTLRKNWFLFSYEYYNLVTTNKKTGHSMHAIMFINQGTESYQLVTDRQQLEDSWDNYQLGTDLFNWTNATGQAPKITLGKEVRINRVTKAAATKIAANRQKR